MKGVRCRVGMAVVSFEPLSKLLVSPLITLIGVPYIIPYITLFKGFRL